ncbi:hypothetical protein CBR_g23764 [Chara braunii]|uniref:3D domain-containing protein n=1 Tax=Chara braunii TaxID=69332 RepID=A0A388JVH2_CHABU|nr:hypothetical protein CBR_g23764 [Chara braunii]GBG61806.1 hypothetical protein CBR_g23764 [Chara braunii]|eukprot:GBG61805.1 hypothetical protein CBR_g23764 [Chara braunii]
MDTTAYCSCGYCCSWEWGLKLPGPHYLTFNKGWVPLKIRKRRLAPDLTSPLVAKYWTGTNLVGVPYKGFTSNGRYPGQSRPPILSKLSIQQYWKIPGRLLLFPWRFFPRRGTIAADTKYYAFGTRMFIPGYGWGEVEDRGGAIKGPDRLDLYHFSHQEALEWGRRTLPVTIVPPGESRVDIMRAPRVVKAVIKGLNWTKSLLI